jgi:hypothetical protein
MEGLLSKNAMRADAARTIALARLCSYHFLAILPVVKSLHFLLYVAQDAQPGPLVLGVSFHPILSREPRRHKRQS